MKTFQAERRVRVLSKFAQPAGYPQKVIADIHNDGVYMAALEQFQSKMHKLQTQAGALAAKRAQSAIDQISELMLEHGLTAENFEVKAKEKEDSEIRRWSDSQREDKVLRQR